MTEVGAGWRRGSGSDALPLGEFTLQYFVPLYASKVKGKASHTSFICVIGVKAKIYLRNLMTFNSCAFSLVCIFTLTKWRFSRIVKGKYFSSLNSVS